jgi:hypothetical protein
MLEFADKVARAAAGANLGQVHITGSIVRPPLTAWSRARRRLSR